MEENKLHRAKTYLSSITDQLREDPFAQLNLSITWSVAVAQDVAHAIIQMAENGEDADVNRVPFVCLVVSVSSQTKFSEVIPIWDNL